MEITTETIKFMEEYINIGDDKIPKSSIFSVNGHWKRDKYAFLSIWFKNGEEWHWEATEDEKDKIEMIRTALHSSIFETMRANQKKKW